MRIATSGSLVIPFVLLSLAAGAASADVYLTARPGIADDIRIVPADEQRRLDTVVPAARPARPGSDFAYGDQQSRLGNLDEGDLRAYHLRAVAKFVPFPNRLSPYAGVGFGLNFSEVDRQTLHRLHSKAEFQYFGVRAATVGFAGIHLPMGEHLSLFTEGRVGASFPLTESPIDQTEAIETRAVSAMTGVRLSF